MSSPATVSTWSAHPQSQMSPEPTVGALVGRTAGCGCLGSAAVIGAILALFGFDDEADGARDAIACARALIQAARAERYHQRPELRIQTEAEALAFLNDVGLSRWTGKKKLLSVFPSIDTPVCALSTKKFGDYAAEHDDTVMLMISPDLPFAHKRFCGDEGLDLEHASTTPGVAPPVHTAAARFSGTVKSASTGPSWPGMLPGVEAQATLAANLLEGRHLRRDTLAQFGLRVAHHCSRGGRPRLFGLSVCLFLHLACHCLPARKF